MPIGVDEEHKVYVPIRGKHVESGPLMYSAQWYEEQGRPITPDTRRQKFARWMRRYFEFDREENHLRIWRLSIWWNIS